MYIYVYIYIYIAQKILVHDISHCNMNRLKTVQHSIGSCDLWTVQCQFNWHKNQFALLL